METTRPQALFARFTAIFVIGLSGWAGCTSPNEPFFRMNNPITFREEAEAIRNLVTAPRARGERPSPDERADAPPEEEIAPVYFGRGDGSALTVTVPAMTPPSEDVVSAPPPGMPVSSGPRTGAVCYRCNGKGYRVAMQGEGAGEANPCADCGGTGRK